MFESFRTSCCTPFMEIEKVEFAFKNRHNSSSKPGMIFNNTESFCLHSSKKDAGDLFVTPKSMDVHQSWCVFDMCRYISSPNSIGLSMKQYPLGLVGSLLATVLSCRRDILELWIGWNRIPVSANSSIKTEMLTSSRIIFINIKIACLMKTKFLTQLVYIITIKSEI